jgi:predicted aldo/keto reductase-like oxidoreductase
MLIQTTVPKQAFGNSGIKISKLCLGGGSFVLTDSEALLDEALKYGVDCWEIVSFTGKAYGEYFKKHPEIREKIFLTGKVYSTDPVVMQEQLNKLLKDNGTSFVDFLSIHQIDDINVLSNDVRKWVEKVKKEKKIRFFGFSTHKNMDACLDGASILGWIDGILTFYNYRMRNIKSMEDALVKCHEKGIGIFAIKSMGFSVQKKLSCRSFR